MITIVVLFVILCVVGYWLLNRFFKLVFEAKHRKLQQEIAGLQNTVLRMADRSIRFEDQVRRMERGSERRSQKKSFVDYALNA